MTYTHAVIVPAANTRERTAITAAIATTVCIWASAFVAIRGALRGGYGPIQLATQRLATASMLLAIWSMSRGVRTISLSGTAL